MHYICKINSTLGLRGQPIAIDTAERARELLARGIIEPVPPVGPEPTPKRRKRKGGPTPEDAGAQA